MGRRKKGEPPAYRKHEASNQAYSFLSGKQVYFGTFGTRESRSKYAKFVKEWERTHGREIVAEAKRARTIEDFVKLYVADLLGSVSDVERQDVKRNLNTLCGMFGAFEPDEFRGAELKSLRAAWIEAGHVRATINKAVGRVRRFFRWLVAEEYCEPDTRAILEAVPDIPSGKMPDNPPVQPVPLEDLLNTMAVMEEPAKSITAVQLYGGPRPSEACEMRGSELFRGGKAIVDRHVIKVPPGLWVFMPRRRKNKRKKIPSAYVFGPKLQAILAPLLKADPDARIFQHEDGSDFDRFALGRAVGRAAKRAKVPHWHPHQVRHLYVTTMEDESDLVTASEGAGHQKLDTTLIYLERKIRSVADVAKRIG